MSPQALHGLRIYILYLKRQMYAKNVILQFIWCVYAICASKVQDGILEVTCIKYMVRYNKNDVCVKC